VDDVSSVDLEDAFFLFGNDRGIVHPIMKLIKI
jgi:hypothetical protein